MNYAFGYYGEFKQIQTDKASGTVGNGGYVVVCTNEQGQVYKAEVLDYAEAALIDVPYDLGGEHLSVKEKVNLVLDRIKTFDQNFYESLTRIHEHYWKYVEFKPGIELSDVRDAYPIGIGRGCKIKQAALIIPDEARYPEQSPYLVSLDLWRLLDKDHQAGLILHEIIYSYFIKKYKQSSSRHARYFHSHIASTQYLQGDMMRYLLLVQRIGEKVEGFKWKPLFKYEKDYVRKGIEYEFVDTRPAGTFVGNRLCMYNRYESKVRVVDFREKILFRSGLKIYEEFKYLNRLSESCPDNIESDHLRGRYSTHEEDIQVFSNDSILNFKVKDPHRIPNMPVKKTDIPIPFQIRFGEIKKVSPVTINILNQSYLTYKLTYEKYDQFKTSQKVTCSYIINPVDRYLMPYYDIDCDNGGSLKIVDINIAQNNKEELIFFPRLKEESVSGLLNSFMVGIRGGLSDYGYIELPIIIGTSQSPLSKLESKIGGKFYRYQEGIDFTQYLSYHKLFGFVLETIHKETGCRMEKVYDFTIREYNLPDKDLSAIRFDPFEALLALYSVVGLDSQSDLNRLTYLKVFKKLDQEHQCYKVMKKLRDEASSTPSPRYESLAPMDENWNQIRFLGKIFDYAGSRPRIE